MEEEHLNHPTAPILCVKIHLFNWVGSCFYVRDVCHFSLKTKPYSTTPRQCNLKKNFVYQSSQFADGHHRARIRRNMS